MTHNDRTELEERVAHIERMLEELSDVVSDLQTELSTLSRRVNLLIEREAERQADGGGGVVLGDERPPHY